MCNSHDIHSGRIASYGISKLASQRSRVKEGFVATSVAKYRAEKDHRQSHRRTNLTQSIATSPNHHHRPPQRRKAKPSRTPRGDHNGRLRHVRNLRERPRRLSHQSHVATPVNARTPLNLQRPAGTPARLNSTCTKHRYASQHDESSGEGLRPRIQQQSVPRPK